MSAETIHFLAMTCLTESGNNVDKAKEVMRRKLLGDKSWLDEMASLAADSAIRRAASSLRDQALRQASSPAARASAVHRALGTSRAKIAQLGIMDLYIVANKPLRQATADDLRRQINHDRSQAETLSNRVAYLTAVLKGLKSGKTVGQSYTNEKLEELSRHFKLPVAA